ncbi:hypothetical protein RBE51_21275 [Pseudomonas taiwanensis]|uniref:hypothetical protein n=1 Tax=Pseudomonas taiwanensis TaxID=470150 RepID=UPI0028DE4497|nr:hypothetical protein [Pseudomonas taiwanensis]MDT8925330.1 hypothetical protein [Pseudomonas taiwanensis]
MDLLGAVQQRKQANTLIEICIDRRFQDCLEPLEALNSLFTDLAASGLTKIINELRPRLLSAFLKADRHDPITGEPSIAPDHMQVLLDTVPFLSTGQSLEAHLGISQALDKQILENLKWCLFEDFRPGCFADYCKVLASKNQAYALQLFDAALCLAENTEGDMAAKHLMYHMSTIPVPWPEQMSHILQNHLPVIQAAAEVPEHWFETLAIVPSLCAAGHENLAQAVFDNTNFHINQLDPGLLDIAHQFFGDKGLSSKLDQLFPVQHGKVGLSSEEVVALLSLVDRYPNLEFPKAQWNMIAKSSSLYYFGPAVIRFLNNLPDSGTGSLQNPEAVNRILTTLIDGAKDSNGIKQQGAKQALLNMLTPNCSKDVLLQLECLREDILTDDLGL